MSQYKDHLVTLSRRTFVQIRVQARSTTEAAELALSQVDEMDFEGSMDHSDLLELEDVKLNGEDKKDG